MTVVGTREPMLDGLAKVTGRLRYAADLQIDGVAHAVLLTSPHPHARVLSLDPAAALAAPGVLGVFWHGNMPAHRYNSSIWFEGQEADADETMFPATVRHIGDRVAVVVAESRPQAEAALDLLEVAYDSLEPCLTPEAADRMRGPLFDAAGAPSFLNPVAERHFAQGDVAAGFAAAAHVTETTVRTPKTTIAPSRPTSPSLCPRRAAASASWPRAKASMPRRWSLPARSAWRRRMCM